MSDTTKRDELAEIIQDCGEYIPGSHADDYVSPDKAAKAILAAGYRKPRMINTAEELDALALKSVVMSSHSAPWQVREDDEEGGRWYVGADDIYFTSSMFTKRHGPFVVLHEGEATL